MRQLSAPKLYKITSARPDIISNTGRCGHTMDNKHVCVLITHHNGHHTDSSRHLHWNELYYWHDFLK